jgi:hypothetical protein
MPLDRLSTTASRRNQPPSTSIPASRGSLGLGLALTVRRSSSGRGGSSGGGGAPVCDGGAPNHRVPSRRQRSLSASIATASSPRNANGRIQPPWSPIAHPNNRSGLAGPPNATGRLALPLGRTVESARGATGRVLTVGEVRRLSTGRGEVCTSAPAPTGMRPGPPFCPPTRPKPLYPKVSPSSELLVEPPTYGRFEAGVRSTKAIQENETSTITRPAASSCAARRGIDLGAHTR